MKIEFVKDAVQLTSESKIEAMQLLEFKMNLMKLEPKTEVKPEVAVRPSKWKGVIKVRRRGWSEESRAKLKESLAKIRVLQQCSQCEKTFRGPAAMGSHMKIHRRKKYKHTAEWLAKHTPVSEPRRIPVVSMDYSNQG